MAVSEEAAVLLALAEDDLEHIREMQSFGSRRTAIFGFHAQQAVEKAAKAWLIVLGQAPPWTHDLNLLLGQLQARGVLAPNLVDGLARLTAFAVRFRYGPPSTVPAIDGADLIARVARFVQAARTAYSEPMQ